LRFLGVDFGGRRVGLAVSDATGVLARPLETLVVRSAAEAVDGVMTIVDRLAREDDGLDRIVVGLPARLDGSPTATTPRVRAFVEALKARTGLPIVTEDERLTSREAESRLAVGERDWKKRKARLDAAAAAIILQDYLDRHA
jgi:putative Holliday junction resolvase